MNNEIAVFKPVEAAIADLSSRYKGVVFQVETTEGMADAKASYKEINTYSITLEKAREQEKAASLAHGRFVDAEAKRIAEPLDALRLPIKAQIEVETKRIERAREAAVQVEADRIATEKKAIADAEAARVAEERAEMERQKAEIVKAQAESTRKIEEEQRASRMAIEEQERVARKAREAEEAQAKAVRDAEESRLKAERDKLDAEKRAIEEVQRKAREAEEAVKREDQRQSNELMDGQAMLKTFVDRFGSRVEFAGVATSIETFLAEIDLLNCPF